MKIPFTNKKIIFDKYKGGVISSEGNGELNITFSISIITIIGNGNIGDTCLSTNK